MNALMFLEYPFGMCLQGKTLINHAYTNNGHQLHKQHF